MAKNRIFSALFVALLLAALPSAMIAQKAPRVCVFVPNVLSGSPTYEEMAKGAQEAVSELPGASLKIVEAGFNQAEWLGKLQALAATGDFDVIVSSNPAMPDLCAQVAAMFPKQRFFVADGWLPGNKAIHTVLYNQIEQGYIVGYLAGLASSGALGKPATHKAGMLVAQHYPSLDKLIQPGFLKGLLAADPKASLEFRVLGNWYDATQAAALASGLFEAGAATILPIAGGAAQGVLSTAKSKGRPIVWFDDNSGFQLAPGTVIGCAIVRQQKLVYEQLKALLAQGPQSKLYGKADIVGVADGYIDFDGSDPAYSALPPAARKAMDEEVAKLRSGKLAFPISGL